MIVFIWTLELTFCTDFKALWCIFVISANINNIYLTIFFRQHSTVKCVESEICDLSSATVTSFLEGFSDVSKALSSTNKIPFTFAARKSPRSISWNLAKQSTHHYSKCKWGKWCGFEIQMNWPFKACQSFHIAIVSRLAEGSNKW